MTKIKPRLIARISCQECRRRKTRCNFDGQGDKCSTCARIGTPCIFAQKNGTVLDINKVLEENNPHLVYQREKERARERERERSMLLANSSSSSAAFAQSFNQIPSDLSLYSKSTPSSFYAAGYSVRPGRSNSTSITQSTRGQGSSTDDLSQVMERLEIDTFGIAPHIIRNFSQVAGDNDSAETSSGESSAAESNTSSRHESASQDSHVTHGGNRNRAGSHPGTYHRSSRSRSVPLVDIEQDLIDIYFRHVHPYILVLHKPSFLRRLHDPKDPVPDFLLAAIYAVASQYAPGREQDGRRYFQLWLSRLDDTLDKPRLSTIQALMLIIKYQAGVKHSGFYFRTYMYTQMVTVLAREMQLHKTTPVNIKLDPESHEVRRRLFWMIFVLDQFIALSQGRTVSFREVEPDADMPSTDIEDPSDHQEIENILNIVEFIKLTKINHQALMLVRKFLTGVVKPEETFPQGQKIHEMMRAWRTNLPQRLRLASNMSPHTPFVAMIHTIYHTCLVMLQRCYAEDPSIGHLEIVATARGICSESATNITVIIDDLYTNHGIPPLTYLIRGGYFTVYCLIAAATIQANDIRRGSSSPIMFKRTLALLNIILRESTAVDVEREVENLKNTMDHQMDHSGNDFSMSQYYEYRPPPLRPILPMSQKYGSKEVSVASGSMSARIRKISPRASGPSQGSSNISSPAVPSIDMGTMGQTFKHGNGVNRGGDGKDNQDVMSGSSQNSNINQPVIREEREQSERIQWEHRQKLMAEEESQRNRTEPKIKLSPSPDIKSLSYSSIPTFSEPLIPSLASSSDFLQSTPVLASTSSQLPNFNVLPQSQPQSQPLLEPMPEPRPRSTSSRGDQRKSRPVSIAQFLAFQEEQQRLQQQQSQEQQRQQEQQQQQQQFT
ncbi:hypothetical protein BGZ80_002690, partial [Entomortierella chlamydospora]